MQLQQRWIPGEAKKRQFETAEHHHKEPNAPFAQETSDQVTLQTQTAELYLSHKQKTTFILSPSYTFVQLNAR